MEIRRTRDVFVAGRYPDLTYNPRNERKQQADLRNYLDDSGKALTISGPSKSGKTVLVQHNLSDSDAIWVDGSGLTNPDVLYGRIIDWLGIYDMFELKQQVSASTGVKLKADLRLPGGTGVGVGVGGDTGEAETKTFARTRSTADVATQGLSELPVPIVIDDFHYVPDDAKREIVRAVKGLIQKTHVILIAVPHEAFDSVRQEPDMNGRIWGLQILPWEVDELVEIAKAGFELLGVVDHGDAVATELARASMGAPFLMQQLCLDYLLDQEILHTQEPAVDLKMSSDLQGFYERVANRSVPGVFDLIASGPKTHGQERSARSLRDGTGVTDIYGAILYAVAQLGPVASIPYRDIVDKIQQLFDDAPSGQQVTSSLGHLSAIAHDNRGDSDAALDYEDDSLHIMDPFLSFYLQHGSWKLPDPPKKK